MLLGAALITSCAEPQQTTVTQTQSTTASSATSTTTSATASAAPAASSAAPVAGHDHSALGSDLTSLQGEAFDRAFLSMMVAHHEGAVTMSQAALSSEDAQVRAWAEGIVSAQEAEIDQMTDLLEPLGGLDEAAAAPMREEMAGMQQHLGHAEDPDRAFVEGMIPHHESALAMAQLAEGRSQNEAVLELARNIITAQEKEIAEFKAYLAN